MVDDAWNFWDYSHGFVLKDERVQKLVNRFLNNPKKEFKFNIPGGSVKEVAGLIPDKPQNPSYWSAQTK
jgi:hypothetical protein